MYMTTTAIGLLLWLSIFYIEGINNMIYLYNDCNEPIWDVVSKNEKFFRIGVIPKYENDKDAIGIDIIKNKLTLDDFFMDILDPEVAKLKNKSLWALADVQFNLVYNSRSGMPFLKPSDSNRRVHHDLYVLAYEIPVDMHLVYVKSNRFNILYTATDTERNMIYIIAVAKPDAKPFFYLTFTDAEQTCVETKHVLIVKANNEVAIFNKRYSWDEAINSPFATTIFGRNVGEFAGPNEIPLGKVMVPYSIIVYPFDKEYVRKDLCEGRFVRNPKYTNYIDANAKNLKNQLRKLTSIGYSAATFYVDKSAAEITEADMKDCPCVWMFKRFNFLCNDGKVRSL